jgi:hypothetical protein
MATKPPGNGNGSRRGRRLAAVPAVFDPPYEVWKLRQAGVPWREAAAQTGYASVELAKVALRVFMQQARMERASEQRAEALQLSIDRYERIIQAYWEDAIMAKRPEAATTILRAMAQSDRVQRLGDEEMETVAPRTIVISPDPETYVAQLKEIVEGGA